MGFFCIAGLAPYSPRSNERMWVYTVWHNSTRGWVFVIFDIFLLALGLIVKNAEYLGYMDEKIVEAYIGATVYIFFFLYENLDRSVHELLRVNVRITLGVGAGIAVVIFTRSALGTRELPVEGISYIAGFYADDVFHYANHSFRIIERKVACILTSN